MTYSGWTNYETWVINVWLDNNESSHYDVKRMSQSATDTFQLETDLREYVEGDAPDLGGTLFGDLLGAAIDSVDWRELAESYFAEWHENDDDSCDCEAVDGIVEHARDCSWMESAAVS